jgi:hypothetical protein
VSSYLQLKATKALREKTSLAFLFRCIYNPVEGTLGLYLETCDLDEMINCYPALLDVMVSIPVRE